MKNTEEMPTETQPSTMNSRLMTILGVAVLIYLSFMLGSIMSTKYAFDFSLVVPRGGYPMEPINASEPLEYFLVEH